MTSFFFLILISCASALKINSGEPQEHPGGQIYSQDGPEYDPEEIMKEVPELDSTLPFGLGEDSLDHDLVQRMKRHVERDHLKMARVPNELMHKSNTTDNERIWPMRPSSTFTWEQHSQTLKNAGRQFCSLVRDNWSCSGQKYEKVLKASAPLHPRWRLENWPEGTRFFGEGNSYFAQLLYTILCDSSAHVWKLEGGNSLFAYSPTSDASVFLFDNHDYWNSNTGKTISLLKDIRYEPTVISLGSLNLGSPSNENRLSAYGQAFKNVPVMPYFGRHLPNDCRADFNNCGAGESHQCIPGPIGDNAGQLVHNIVKALGH